MTPRQVLNKVLMPLRLHVERLPKDYFGLSLYAEQRRPSAPRYLNIGALDFRHPLWHTLDNPTDLATFAMRQRGNIDIAHDLMSEKPLPVENGTLVIAYCSHVIEHLRDQDVARLFREVYRILEAHGIFRLVMPDAELFHQAYARGDAGAFGNALKLYRASTLEQKLLMQFATALVREHPAKGAHTCSDEEVRSTFQLLSMTDFYNHFACKLPVGLQSQYPADHINWFTMEKVKSLLRDAGFTNIWRSGHLQSQAPQLRNKHLFDPYPDHSLYVECRK